MSTDARPTVSATVHDRLRAEILSGRLGVGDPIPSERALAEQHSVNRHAVREAVKRLQQAGLVAVSQGGATVVRDWRRTAGLDLLGSWPLLAADSGDGVILRDALEMRASIGIDVVRRCAQRAGAVERAEVAVRAAALAPDVVGDLEGTHERYIAFWDAVIDGADNLAYRLAYNSLIGAVGEIGAGAAHLFAREMADVTTFEALTTAVVEGDAEAAARAADALLSPTANEAGAA
ncbi:MAG TPA: GntR family transcriptional regulator [Mycobacteriales bacterium]|nr:GntR family transcriptional regulator [Mycobacteriales bacterium]